jgi:WD40 repeat protein
MLPCSRLDIKTYSILTFPYYCVVFSHLLYYIIFIYTARSENKLLKEKLQKSEQQCKILTKENQALKAEVEIYREDMVSVTNSAEAGGTDTRGSCRSTNDKDHFVTSGNSVYAQAKEVTLEKLHGIANPSCCSLSDDDTILATGGADRTLTLCQWGGALSGPSQDVVAKAVKVECGAPVIATDFARKSRSPFLAAGCMDGSVHVVHIETHSGVFQAKEVGKGTIQHAKYVRGIAWSPHENLVASASADGCVQVHKVVWNGFDNENIQLEKVQTLMLSGPVESLCFHQTQLVCYARGTPFLSYFDLSKDWLHTKHNLNQGPGNAWFDDHVSFAVMDICAHGEYLALATDTSRNIIVEFATATQIRNLYGHQNDSYANPKVAFSANGKYLFGNTQDESSLVVWDIASAEIVQRLKGHDHPIRDLFSSKITDTMVTTSFDKKTHIWLAPSE